MAHAGGRPSLYTEELAARICYLIATNAHSVKIIASKFKDIPDDTTIYSWLAKYPEFSRQYLEAKEIQAHIYSDTVMDYIWDVDERPEAIAKANAILNGAKWHLSKLAPKQFGDKKEVKSQVTLDVHEDRLKELE